MENQAKITAKASLLSGVGISDVGCQRGNNEDSMVCQQLWNKHCLLAVAIDGVGGQEGGEIAAEIAMQKIPEYLNAYPNGDVSELLKQAVKSVNDEILKQRSERQGVENMSCVLTAVVVDSQNGWIHMAHVGDTRLYQFVDGELQKLSHDHSIVGYREEIGDLTEEEAMHHPQRNLISRVVGNPYRENEEYVETASFPLIGHSTLMLCSDGLCDMITSAQMTQILAHGGRSLEKKCQQLIGAAKAAGGKDNVTVVLVEYTGRTVVKDAPKPSVQQSDVVQATGDEPVWTMATSGKKHRRWGWIVVTLTTALLLASAGFLAGLKYPSIARNHDAPEPECSIPPYADTSLLKNLGNVVFDTTSVTTDTMVVKEYHTNGFLFGSDNRLLSASGMIGLIESTCHESVQKHLPVELTTVSAKVSVSMTRSSANGAKVWCMSRLVAREGLRLVFDVEEADSAGVFCSGRHERDIVSLNKVNGIVADSVSTSQK